VGVGDGDGNTQTKGGGDGGQEGERSEREREMLPAGEAVGCKYEYECEALNRGFGLQQADQTDRQRSGLCEAKAHLVLPAPIGHH